MSSSPPSKRARRYISLEESSDEDEHVVREAERPGDERAAEVPQAPPDADVDAAVAIDGAKEMLAPDDTCCQVCEFKQKHGVPLIELTEAQASGFVECEKCNRDFHPACVGLAGVELKTDSMCAAYEISSFEDYGLRSAELDPFFCPACLADAVVALLPPRPPRSPKANKRLANNDKRQDAASDRAHAGILKLYGQFGVSLNALVIEFRDDPGRMQRSDADIILVRCGSRNETTVQCWWRHGHGHLDLCNERCSVGNCLQHPSSLVSTGKQGKRDRAPEIGQKLRDMVINDFIPAVFDPDPAPNVKFVDSAGNEYSSFEGVWASELYVVIDGGDRPPVQAFRLVNKEPEQARLSLDGNYKNTQDRARALQMSDALRQRYEISKEDVTDFAGKAILKFKGRAESPDEIITVRDRVSIEIDGRLFVDNISLLQFIRNTASFDPFKQCPGTRCGDVFAVVYLIAAEQLVSTHAVLLFHEKLADELEVFASKYQGLFDTRVADLAADHEVYAECPTVTSFFRSSSRIDEYATIYGIGIAERGSFQRALGGLDAAVADGHFAHLLDEPDRRELDDMRASNAARGIKNEYTVDLDPGFLIDTFRDAKDGFHRGVRCEPVGENELKVEVTMGTWESGRVTGRSKLNIKYRVRARARPGQVPTQSQLESIMRPRMATQSDSLTLVHASSRPATESIVAHGMVPVPAQNTQAYPINFCALGAKFVEDEPQSAVDEADFEDDSEAVLDINTDCLEPPDVAEICLGMHKRRATYMTPDEIQEHQHLLHVHPGFAMLDAMKITTNTGQNRRFKCRNRPIQRSKFMEPLARVNDKYKNVVLQRNTEEMTCLVYTISTHDTIPLLYGAGSHLRNIPENIRDDIGARIERDDGKPVLGLESFASLMAAIRHFAVALRSSKKNIMKGGNRTQVDINNEFLGPPVLAIDFDVVREGEADVQQAKERATDVKARLNALFTHNAAVRQCVLQARPTAHRYKFHQEQLKELQADLSKL